MNRTDLAEAVAIVGRMLDALLAAPGDRTTEAAAGLRTACGDLRASVEAKLRAAELGTAMLACFDFARLAGATPAGMAAVRAGIERETPAGLAGVAVAQAGVRCSLIQEARILAATTFASRDDVEAAQVRVNAGFDPAIDYAADAHDGAAYQALVALHAAVIRDLAERGRRLPRRVSYTFATARPALALANRIYGDASRAGELMAENRVPHPLFMPRSGWALSA
jgi:hypothetical protein